MKRRVNRGTEGYVKRTQKVFSTLPSSHIVLPGMSSETLEHEAIHRQVLHKLEKYHSNDIGTFIGAAHGQTGARLQDSGILEDLGDTVPFLIEAGNVELARKQVAAALEAMKETPIHQNERRTKRRWMLDSYDLTDLLLGLMDWYDYEQDNDVRLSIEELLQNWKAAFSIGHRFYGKSLQWLKWPLPLMTPYDLGMFPELLLRWGATSENKQYRQWAAQIVDSFLEDAFFQETGLFPLLSAPFTALGWVRPCNTARLFKDNTNLFASLLALYRETGDEKYASAISNWHRGVKTRLMSEDGSLRTGWSRDGRANAPDLTNFQVIDLLCDAAVDCEKNEYLATASRIADFWLAQQRKTGLFPQYADRYRDSRTYGDTQTDMTVALFKLSELSAGTERERYESAALRCYKGTWRFHHSQYGFVNSVNADTGEVLDYTSKTKFLALSLKAWIAYQHRGKIYASMELRNKLGDR